MKISQMTTDQAADALIRIAEPASNIMHNEDTIAMLDKIAHGNDNAIKFIADNIVTVASVLLKTHRDDMYEILAALTDKNREEIAGQKFTQTVKDIKECWDGDLVDFFVSSGK